MSSKVIVSSVSAKWANGRPVSREDRLAFALLRQAGCTCEFPLLRNARDDDENMNDGPRCKTCNASVVLIEPTAEEELAYRCQSHQVAVWYDKTHPGVFDAIGWKSKCFPGCGCDEPKPESPTAVEQEKNDD